MTRESTETLRAEHVRATRNALVLAGRQLFGSRGFAATSVEDVARLARVTTGALYHHFPNKIALFETVFSQIHRELGERSATAASRGRDPLDRLARGFDAFLDAVLEPDVQRILVVDAPSVLGVERFTELDEKDAIASIVSALRAADAEGTVVARDAETMARLLLGALVRGGLEVATATNVAQTRKAVSRALRQLITGLGASR